MTLSDIDKIKNKICLTELIKKRNLEFYNNINIKCPDIINDINDLNIVRMPLGKPNFITNKKIVANIKKFNKKNKNDNYKDKNNYA